MKDALFFETFDSSATWRKDEASPFVSFVSFTGRQPPRPYAFSWNVQDAASRNDYGHHEESDGKIVAGSYRVLLPDGRTQTVTYTVRGDEGYVAHVVYSGGAH